MSDWDAASYDRLAEPQEQWGLAVLDRLELAGDETVLDAGCGAGRMTRHLVERLPKGRVIGVDSSTAMIEKARERLGDSAELRVGDLLDLALEDPVDAVFSNAALHWIADHERLFARLRGLLRPGGALEAQCGGQGNIADFEAALLAFEGDERFAPYLRGFASPWTFAGIGDTEARLGRAGFEEVRVWVEEVEVVPGDPREYIRSSCLPAHMARLPESLRVPFVESLMASLPRPVRLAYVRLNISARRPA